MGDLDDGSVRNATTPKIREKKGGDSSPLATNSKSQFLSANQFNDSANGNDF